MTQAIGQTDDYQMQHLQQLITDLDSVRVQFEQLAKNIYLALEPVISDFERAYIVMEPIISDLERANAAASAKARRTATVSKAVH